MYFRKGCIYAGKRKDKATLTVTPGHIRQLAPAVSLFFRRLPVFGWVVAGEVEVGGNGVRGQHGRGSGWVWGL